MTRDAKDLMRRLIALTAMRDMLTEHPEYYSWLGNVEAHIARCKKELEQVEMELFPEELHGSQH